MMKKWFILSFLAVTLTLPPLGHTTEPSTYHVKNGVIYHNHKPIPFYGVNWFGFETTDNVVHGLWSRGYKDMIAQMKSLGFNAVRIPFCPMTLQNVDITVWTDFSKNPDLEGLKSLEVMDKIVEEFNTQQMYILLDHHRPDCENISELWYTENYSEEDWINDLVFVAERYKGINYFMGIDLKNEPHGQATWGTGNIDTDWNLAAERAAQAILAINPNILIFVEGIQENPICSSTINHWWGGNLEPQQCYPFNIPPEKLVQSPHVYGPDVYPQPYFNEPDFPNNMPAIWETHFGYLTETGDTLAIGEFGGKYGHDGGDPKDVAWQNAFVDYLIDKRICNFFYWSWNPNSGDTGGILQDDWTTIWQDKYDNLHRLMMHCEVLFTLDNDVIIDFGPPYGIYAYLNNNSWASIHGIEAKHLLTGDLDGNGFDEVIIDFDAYGIYVWLNNSQWVKLHSLSAKQIVVGDLDGNHQEDVVMDFDTYGLWVWMNNQQWVNLHSLSAKHFATGDMDGNNQDDVIIDFDTYGFWVWMNNNQWVSLHSLSAKHLATGDMDGNNQHDVIIDFGSGIGIYARMNNNSWVKVHGLSAKSMVTGDLDGNHQDDVIIDFGSGIGIYAWMNNSSWAALHGLSAESMVTGDVDANGQDDVIINFGAPYGVYVRMNNSHWAQLHSLPAQHLVTGNIDGLASVSTVRKAPNLTNGVLHDRVLAAPDDWVPLPEPVVTK